MPTSTPAKLNGQQIETILDRLVPILADPADHGFFRGVLAVKFENCSSAEAGRLVRTLLQAQANTSART